MLKCIMIRLDKFIAKALGKTRTEAKKLIKIKKIYVNDLVITKNDFQIDIVNDIVKFNNEILKYNEYVYFMMNKPKKYISSTSDFKSKTIIDLLSENDKKYNTFPIGRLDKDTEGLIILTNNGKLAHKLLSPKHHIPKTYYVRSMNPLSKFDIEQLENGIIINKNYLTKKAKVIVISKNEINLEITEGKYHQIKKMFEAINNKVVYLKRIKMNNLLLDDKLKLGKYRKLTELEYTLLKGDL